MSVSHSTGEEKIESDMDESNIPSTKKGSSDFNSSKISDDEIYSEIDSSNIQVPEDPSKNYLLWIDKNSNNKENNLYKSYIKKNYDKYNIICFKDVESSIKKIKELSFEETYVIVSGRLYKEFIKSIMDNLTSIKVIPKIVIFTGNKETFLEYNNDLKSQNILNNKFYSLGGIQTNFINVFNFLSTDDWKIRPTISGDLKDKGPKTEELTFEYIDSLESLMLPRFFRTLIQINKDDNFDELNQYLVNKYKTNADLKSLLSQIEGVPSIPIEILCKYYARLYSIESDLYENINHNLRQKKLMDLNVPKIQKLVLSYVKLMYEGLKLNCFPFECAKILYRFSCMSKSEKNRLEEYLFKKKEGIPAAICFSKAFLSFSEDREVAEYFLIKHRLENKGNNDLISVIFILQKNEDISNDSLRTFINLSNFAQFKKEKEVLFLPFSAFEINAIKEVYGHDMTYYEIKLDYLDKYTDKLKSISNNKIIKNTNFGKEFFGLGLVNKTKIEYQTNKDLIDNYEQFDKKFIENKQIIINNEYSKHIEKKLNKDLIYYVKKEDIDENGEVQILGEHKKGEDFLKLNHDNSYLIINGKKEELCYKYKLKEGINRIEIILNEKVTNLRAIFKYCTSLIDISALENWDVKDITCLSCSFRGCTSLLDLSPLKNWKFSNLLDLNACFEGDNTLTDISALENWDVSKVTFMEGTFSHCACLSDISVLKNWNVGNVKKFHNFFEGCKNLKDISPLKNWNVSNCTCFNGMFMECSSLTDISPLKNWDVSKGLSFNEFFKNCFNLKDIFPINGWNVAKATCFNNFFEGCVLLKDISSLDNWKMSKDYIYVDFIKGTQIEKSKIPSWYSKNK